MRMPPICYAATTLGCGIAILVIGGSETAANRQRHAEQHRLRAEFARVRSDAARERAIFVSHEIASVGTGIERDFSSGAFIAGDPIKKLFDRYRPDTFVREKSHMTYHYRGSNRDCDHGVTIVAVDGKMVRAMTTIRRAPGEFVRGHFFGKDWEPPFTLITDEMLKAMRSVDLVIAQFGLLGPIGVVFLANYTEH